MNIPEALRFAVKDCGHERDEGDTLCYFTHRGCPGHTLDLEAIAERLRELEWTEAEAERLRRLPRIHNALRTRLTRYEAVVEAARRWATQDDINYAYEPTGDSPAEEQLRQTLQALEKEGE